MGNIFLDFFNLKKDFKESWVGKIYYGSKIGKYFVILIAIVFTVYCFIHSGKSSKKSEPNIPQESSQPNQ